MLRIAICDDDKCILITLSEYLTHYSFLNNCELEIRTFSTAQELLDTEFSYQILFLDIMLDSGKDGIELAKQIRKTDSTSLIIIISSRSDRHEDAIEATIFWYVIKPFTQDRIYTVLDEAFAYWQKNHRFFPIRFKQETVYIPLQDIILIESYARKRYIYLHDRTLKTVETWQNILERVGAESCFFKPQKMLLVNLNHIQSSSKTGIVMDNGRMIAFNKSGYRAFQTAYNTFLGELL